MAIRCRKCGREFDVTLFQFGREITCPCGARVKLEHVASAPEPDPLDELLKEIETKDKRRKMDELKRMADKVAYLILSTDYLEIDIEIEKGKVREKCRQLFPDRMDLYEMIYESRFRRLWQQFREYSNDAE